MPEISLSLNAQGELQLALPGAASGPRFVELRDDESLGTILKAVLQGQRAAGSAIGTAGAPTQALSDHWRHVALGRTRRGCPWCEKPSANGLDGVAITRLTAAGHFKAEPASAQSAEDLGL